MSEHFNGLTPVEHEALTLLMEECGEVVQAIGKIFRHGLESHYHLGISNREQLEIECADVLCSIELLIRDRVLSKRVMDCARQIKINKFRSRPEMLHHVKPL